MRSVEELAGMLAHQISLRGVPAFPEYARGQHSVPDAPVFVTVAAAGQESTLPVLRLNGRRELPLTVLLRVRMHGDPAHGRHFPEAVWNDAVLPAIGALRLAVRRISRGAAEYDRETGTRAQTAEITVCAVEYGEGREDGA